MKIAINGRILINPHLEGIGRYTHEVISRMVQNHPEHTFYIFHDRQVNDMFKYGLNCHNIKIGLPTRHPILWRLWMDYYLTRAIKHISPDVFFSPESFKPLSLEVPSIITTHDIVYEYYHTFNRWSHQQYYQRYSPKWHKTADQIITVSNFTKKTLIDKYRISPNKIKVIYNGISDDYYPIPDQELLTFRKENDITEPFLLYVGSIHPRKNIELLIEAFGAYKRTNISSRLKLVLVGRMAWKYDKVLAAIKTCEYRKDIHHFGYYSGDLNKLMNCAKAFVYPSLFEGFGLPIVESMAAGTPAIVSDSSAHPEIGANAAYYFNPNSVESLAIAIQEVINNQQIQNKLRSAGLNRAKDFSWDAASSEVYDFIEQLGNQSK